MTALVYRDAARAHGFGVAMVVLPSVYLYREWPPWAVRAALGGLLPAPRAAVAVVSIVVYAWLTAAPVRTLLASNRLVLLRTLPLTHGWWRRTHALHLVALDAPWLGLLAYAVAPRDTTPAVMAWSSGAGLTIALQIALLAFADRPWIRRCVVVMAALAMFAAWRIAEPWVAAALGVAMWTLAHVRCGAPFPEVRARVSGLARWLGARGAVRGWARLLVVVWVRRAPLVVAATILVQVAGVAAVDLGRRHVGDIDARGLEVLCRFVAVLGAWIGAAGLLHAVRGIDRDRAWIDALPLGVAVEHRGRLLAAAVCASPMLTLALVLPSMTLEVVVALGWAVAVMNDLVSGRERARALHVRVIPRLVLGVVAALALVLAVGHTTALVPWIVLALLRGRHRLVHATTVRARFETPRDEDDHGS